MLESKKIPTTTNHLTPTQRAELVENACNSRYPRFIVRCIDVPHYAGVYWEKSCQKAWIDLNDGKIVKFRKGKDYLVDGCPVKDRAIIDKRIIKLCR